MQNEAIDENEKIEADAIVNVVTQTVDVDMTPGELQSLLTQLDYLERKAKKSPYWAERMAPLAPLLDRLKAKVAK